MSFPKSRASRKAPRCTKRRLLGGSSVKRQNDRILKEELPRSVGAQYATGQYVRFMNQGKLDKQEMARAN